MGMWEFLKRFFSRRKKKTFMEILQYEYENSNDPEFIMAADYFMASFQTLSINEIAEFEDQVIKQHERRKDE